MGAPVSLLQGARAFARDMPREAMTTGYLWDVADYVPALIDTQLTSRGGWTWGSNSGGQDWNAGILATFTPGEQLLATCGATVYQIDPTSGALTSRGGCPVGRQNPVQLFDQVVWFEQSGAHLPYWIGPTGNAAPVSGPGCPNANVGCIWKTYVIAGGAPGQEDTIRFSAPNDVNLAWDAASLIRTGGAITGLAALRSLILVFHAGRVERIRGSTPPVTGAPQASDLVLEPVFQQAGTTEPRTICYWNENVLFADEHGCHMTDGSVIRNLVSQGSISSYWRMLYGSKTSLAAAVFLDFYIVTVNTSDGGAVTLICDLNKRQWFRFTNVPAVCMWASGGTAGMERIWAGIRGTNRLGRLGPCFFPPSVSSLTADANGISVLPSFETPWYKLSRDSEGRKRIRFVYLSYDARTVALARGRSFPDDEEQSPPVVAPLVSTASVLQCSYILSPQDTTWTLAGSYPSTGKYTRWRLPVGKMPYGIAFQVKQVAPTSVTRISDLEIEARAVERSRV